MWLCPIEYSDEHSAYFATLGRAVALAQNFEQNLKFVFGTVDLGIAFEQGKLEAGGKWREYGRELMARSLKNALSKRREDRPISAEDFTVLEAAREARNYLAHEAALAGLYIPPQGGKLRGAAGLKRFMNGLVDIERERAEMLVDNFRSALPRIVDSATVIARADNIMAGLSYLIQEKADHLPSIEDDYVETVVAWVLEPIRIAGLAEGQ